MTMRNFRQFFSLKRVCVILGAAFFLLQSPVALSSYAASPDDILTPQERIWLNTHRDQLTVVISNWAPYDFFNNQGAHTGYVAEYLELLQKKLNVRFQLVRTSTWAEAEALALDHKVAMVTSLKSTPERSKRLNFAGPFRIVPVSIVTRDNVFETMTLAKLQGKTVAIVTGYFTVEEIRRDHPGIQIVLVPDDVTGIRQLSLGKVDAFISDVGVVAHFVEREGIHNLKVAGETSYEYVLNIGIRNDWPILADILQKGMDSISPAENDQIYKKWVNLAPRNIWQTQEFWLIMGAIVAVACLIVLLVATWNLTLRRKVAERTQELAASETKYRSIFDNAIAGIFQATPQGELVAANDSFARMLGYPVAAELMATVQNFAPHWAQSETAWSDFASLLTKTQSVENYETQLCCQNDSQIWVMINANLVVAPARNQILVEGTCIDIQERKLAEQKLLAYQELLEQRVEERTQELTASNEELAALNQDLIEEVTARRQIENDLLLREKQYHATVSLLTGATSDTEELLNSILREAIRLVKAPGGTIGLLNETSGAYVISHAAGNTFGATQLSHAAADGLFGELQQQEEVIHIPDYRQYAHRISHKYLDCVTTIIMTPLKQDGQMIGAFTALWSGDVHPVTVTDIEVLRQYGNLASIALEQARSRKQMTHMAYQDNLTGLHNRTRLMMQLEEEMARACCGQSAGAILYIDLDDLKLVNDNFGHSCGDGLIIAAGSRILETIGSEGFVARMGGDEFIVLLAGENRREQVAKLADRLVQELHGDFEVCGHQMHLSASIGVTLYPEDARSAEEIMQTADSAMYAAKAAGRNCWRFFENWMSEQAYTKMVLTQSLRTALERGELSLQYQPQWSLSPKAIVGFEALLRWNSPEHGKVPPDRFIPLAEQSGLILSIGEWVAAEACRFAAKLTKMGRPDLHVAVNVSPRQLESENFVPMLEGSIHNAGITPEQLELEITENILISSLDENIHKLEVLTARGFRLSLDDFGTGYSSLTYLRRLPVQTLKIDKSFIENAEPNSGQLDLLQSIISMAHVLKLLVVAEGVETSEQLALLESMGCDRVQGYCFSRPVVEADALGMLK